MKAALLGLSLCTLLSCKNTDKKSVTDMTDTAATPRTTFYLGTYTDGESLRIFSALLRGFVILMVDVARQICKERTKN